MCWNAFGSDAVGTVAAALARYTSCGEIRRRGVKPRSHLSFVNSDLSCMHLPVGSCRKELHARG